MGTAVRQRANTLMYDEYVSREIISHAISIPKEFRKYPKFHIYVEPVEDYIVGEIKANKYAHLFSAPEIDTKIWKFNREEANAR
ncbi:hypothetical protein FACS1894125_7390 [Actinomycetota bacterium]|nr:hypothetical protein FACS1894125_7390 [Actinomycetota bacterium]